MSGYRVSVIVRTFNRPAMLRRALESIAGQTWADREAVVINDGGEDVSEILAAFEDRLDIVHLAYPPEEKPGRCLAATRGIEASTGDWICYCDDDDFYHPDHLETLMTAARETGMEIFYTDANIGTETPDEAGEYVITDVGPGPSQDFSRAQFYHGCYIHLSTFCHHRRLFDEQGGFDPELPVLEDLDMFFRYSHDHEFHHIKKVTAQFQVRTDNTNAVTSMRKEFQETFELLSKKYLHYAVSDMVNMIRDGRVAMYQTIDKVAALVGRIEDLEARLARLEGKS